MDLSNWNAMADLSVPFGDGQHRLDFTRNCAGSGQPGIQIYYPRNNAGVRELTCVSLPIGPEFIAGVAGWLCELIKPGAMKDPLAFIMAFADTIEPLHNVVAIRRDD